MPRGRPTLNGVAARSIPARCAQQERCCSGGAHRNRRKRHGSSVLPRHFLAGFAGSRLCQANRTAAAQGKKRCAARSCRRLLSLRACPRGRTGTHGRHSRATVTACPLAVRFSGYTVHRKRSSGRPAFGAGLLLRRWQPQRAHPFAPNEGPSKRGNGLPEPVSCPHGFCCGRASRRMIKAPGRGKHAFPLQMARGGVVFGLWLCASSVPRGCGYRSVCMEFRPRFRG